MEDRRTFTLQLTPSAPSCSPLSQLEFQGAVLPAVWMKDIANSLQLWKAETFAAGREVFFK